MTSAALQTSLATPPLIATSSPGHQYTSTHSSPSREAYNAHSQNTASPSSSRRPSRSRSGNGNGASHFANSPNSSQQAFNASMTTRAANLSPVAVAAPSPDYQSSNSERRRNMPPVAPPRTSSTNQSNTAGGGGNTRRAATSSERAAASPRHGQTVENSRATANGNMEAAGADESRRSTSKTRRVQQMAQQPPERTSSTREGRTGGVATIPIRTAPDQSAASRSAAGAPNEANHHESNGVQGGTASAGGDAAPPPVAGPGESEESSRRGGRSRHDRSSRRERSTKFGEYILGNVIGEGEFGKVRLGWKQSDGVQVAIKIIKKESLGNNPARLGKIHREVNILKGLTHPNIVQLHAMIGDETRIGIVLEYASGGELFDYILNHRYLKDNAARRLFAQLISGVGYLHKKGIVHRDLKLENLLLDRNRNIIITDFGFANVFDPKDELTEEEELNLNDREYVKNYGLDKLKANGTRRGDLMQTSCGSPCYAAPELVVSDSLYTGRKVDVWSCGVILYAMLAGYLPFDDDPANPEGDNINLLYKYIVNTPLTFPEYVSPHARDLLRRILVPNPRRRADLFEVARHSWLSEYAHVVRVITSSTTTSADIQNTTVSAEEYADAPGIARSASVREASKAKAAAPVVGGLVAKHGNIDQDAEAAALAKQQKDAKRRTVQVEYVAPTTQTQRGDYSGYGADDAVRSGREGAGEGADAGAPSPKDKPLPRDPPVSKDSYSKGSRKPPSAHRQQNAAPSRPSRDTRATSDGVYMTTAAGASGRPPTEGSIGPGTSGRGGYGQPAPPTVAGTNVHGRIQQPSGGEQDAQTPTRPGVPAKFARVTGFSPDGQSPQSADFRGHKRSSTIGDIGSKILERSGSLFGGRNRKRSEQQSEKGRKYPPISMANNMPPSDEPRQSMDSKASRRSISLGFGKRRSGSMTGSRHSQEKQSRRFSLIPHSLTKAIGLSKDYGSPASQTDLPMQEARDDPRRHVDSRQRKEGTPIYDSMHQTEMEKDMPVSPTPARHQRYSSAQYEKRPSAIPPYMHQGAVLNTGSDSSMDGYHRRQHSAPYQAGFSQSDGYEGGRLGARQNRGVLQKNKRFTDAYDQNDYRGHEGSSGAAKRVMDFFRRRGKARGGEER